MSARYWAAEPSLIASTAKVRATSGHGVALVRPSPTIVRTLRTGRRGLDDKVSARVCSLSLNELMSDCAVASDFQWSCRPINTNPRCSVDSSGAFCGSLSVQDRPQTEVESEAGAGSA